MEDNLVKEDFIFVGFWKRVAANFLDMVFLLPLIILYMNFYKIILEKRMIIPFIVYYSVFYFYNIIFNALLGGTPGKLVLKYRIVNNEGQYLSVPKAFLRYSLYIPQTLTFILLNFVIIEHSPILDFIDMIFSFIIMIDALFVVFNQKKRALHDYIANSYVVTKESLKLNKRRNC